MAAFILPVMCFLLALMQNADCSLIIDVSTTVISPGFTESLIVNCSFYFDGDPDLAALTSLIIAKENQQGEYDHILSSNVFSPIVTGADEVNGIVSGQIQSDANSFLSVEWQFPSLDESGAYRCQANGIDKLGHSFEQDSKTVNVSAQVPSLDLLITKLSEVERQLEYQETLVQNQSHTINTLLSLVQAQTDTISQQTDTITNYTNTVTDMQDKLDFQNSLMKELAFHISPEYQGHQYMLSKQNWNNSTISQQTCEDYGGYLVEINDAEEQAFVYEFLNSLVGFDLVLISGTELGHEQSWTYTYSGGPLTYTHWYSTEPNSANWFCIYMIRGNSWYWSDYPCVHGGTNYRFLCEGNIN